MVRFTSIFFLLIATICSPVEADTRWQYKTKGRVYSTPVIVGDMIFFGSGDHRFYALDKKNGKQKWSFETGGAVHSSAAVKDKRLFFGSADGHLYAIDKDSGQMTWKFASGGEKAYGLWDYYLSSPAVEGDSVFWGSGDGHVYALDAATGELQWKYDTGDVVHASPVVYKNRVYIGGFDGHMYALDKNDGALVWKFKTVGATYFPKGEIQKAALVEDDVVYFGSRDYNIYALDANTGRGKWNLKQPQGWIIATPTEYEGNVYFGTSDAHIFYSMNKTSGTVNWTIPLNMRVYGTATVDRGIVYFGTFDGKVLGIDYLTGETRWQFQTESSKRNYSTVYNEQGEFNESFSLYGADYRTPENMIHALGSILSSPVIEDGVIYFGSSDGHLYSVELP